MPYKDIKDQRKNKDEWRKNHPDYFKEWREKNKTYYKEYRDNPENKLKQAMRMLVNRNIQKGLLTKPLNCEDCKLEIKSEGHHEDYNKPLEVKWLCKKCHEKLHRIY